MKTANLGDFLEWKGRVYKIEWINDGRRSIGMRSLDQNKCPHCNQNIGHDTMDIIEASPLFQENAEPVRTISDDPTIII